MELDPTAIKEFRGAYGFLSNFYPCVVQDDRGTYYPSTEHAYQAMKFLGKDRRKIFEDGSPGSAKSNGKGSGMRDDWEAVKLEVMLNLLRQKFKAGSNLAQRLLDTGDRELIEGNYWGDTFWGVCKGVGQNNLGKLLMQVRKELRESLEEPSLW